MMQMLGLAGEGGLNFNSRNRPDAAPARARTISKPLESARITISIATNASLGIRIVVLPFRHHCSGTFCAVSQDRCFRMAGCSRLASLLNSAPLPKYAVKRARQTWHVPMCSAASRGTSCPSHRRETNSAAPSHFMNPPFSLVVSPAIFFSTLRARRTNEMPRFQRVLRKPAPARRRNSLPLRVAR